MRPHDLDPSDPLPVLAAAPFAIGDGLAVMLHTAGERERAEAWLSTIDPALVPLARELQRSTLMDALQAAETVAAWWHNVPIEPADELAILQAAGEGDSVRAAVLGVRIATNELAAAFASVAAGVASVRVPGVPNSGTPLNRRERRAQRRAARKAGRA